MASRPRKDNKAQSFYEVNCCAGLERFVQRELRHLCSKEHQLSKDRNPGEVIFSYNGDWKALRTLETADDVFRILPFKISRPRGILEPLVLRQITEFVKKLTPSPRDLPLKSFRVSAAGTDSKDLVRIRQVLSKETGLTEDQEDGDLLIRLRRSRIMEDGWDVLIRLTRRPLHVRRWRSADYRGALSAPIARVMVELLDAQTGHTFLDPMCGSGTLLVEQLRFRPVKTAYGMELSEKVLESTRKNLSSIKVKTTLLLSCGDATHLPLEDGTIDCIATNPPWGEAIKESQGLATLYRKLLSESNRVLKKKGKMCLIIQNTGALTEALSADKNFEVIEKLQVLQKKGFHPTIYLLQKR